MKFLEFDTGIPHPQNGSVSPSVKISIAHSHIQGVYQFQHQGNINNKWCVLMLIGGGGPIVYGNITELTEKLNEIQL